MYLCVENGRQKGSQPVLGVKQSYKNLSQFILIMGNKQETTSYIDLISYIIGKCYLSVLRERND